MKLDSIINIVFDNNFLDNEEALCIWSFFKFIFNWKIIALQYSVGFCHTSIRISHRYTHVPSLVNLPLTSHPSRLSQSTSLSFLHHTANFFWLSISHMVIYKFPCYSVSSSHPLLPPLCPQVCAL